MIFENTPLMLLQDVYRNAVHAAQMGLEAAFSLCHIIATFDGTREGLGFATFEPRVVVEGGFVLVYPAAISATVEN